MLYYTILYYTIVYCTTVLYYERLLLRLREGAQLRAHFSEGPLQGRGRVCSGDAWCAGTLAWLPHPFPPFCVSRIAVLPFWHGARFIVFSAFPFAVSANTPFQQCRCPLCGPREGRHDAVSAMLQQGRHDATHRFSFLFCNTVSAMFC